MCEKVLDVDNWKLEATAVINDIKLHVIEARISEKLQSGNDCVYINLTTLENSHYCIELSPMGFRVVAEEYDGNMLQNYEYYETPYGLLNKISPMYAGSFANALLTKLKELE